MSGKLVEKPVRCVSHSAAGLVSVFVSLNYSLFCCDQLISYYDTFISHDATVMITLEYCLKSQLL